MCRIGEGAQEDEAFTSNENLKTFNGITGEMQPIPVDYTTIRYLIIAAITLAACSAAGFFPARKASSGEIGGQEKARLGAEASRDEDA